MSPRDPWRVFLVEDDLLFACLVAQVLATDGRFSLVGLADSADEAATGIHATVPDVVLLDHGLPHAWDAQAATVLRSRAPAAQIVILSASPAPIDYASLGVDSWIAKTDVSRVPDFLNSVLSRRQK